MTTLTIPDVTVPSAYSRPDGGNWLAAILFNDGSATFADSMTELLGAVINGYEPDDSDEAGTRAALDDRYDFVVGAANARQAVVAFAATQEGLFDPAENSEDVLTALFSPREEFIATFESWDHTVPLVLVDTDYYPYTEQARPTGNIEWLNPATELSLLQSLSTLGVFELWIHSEA